jgi:hypothetical protein
VKGFFCGDVLHVAAPASCFASSKIYQEWEKVRVLWQPACTVTYDELSA